MGMVHNLSSPVPPEKMDGLLLKHGAQFGGPKPKVRHSCHRRTGGNSVAQPQEGHVQFRPFLDRDESKLGYQCHTCLCIFRI